MSCETHAKAECIFQVQYATALLTMDVLLRWMPDDRSSKQRSVPESSSGPDPSGVAPESRHFLVDQCTFRSPGSRPQLRLGTRST